MNIRIHVYTLDYCGLEGIRILEVNKKYDYLSKGLEEKRGKEETPRPER